MTTCLLVLSAFIPRIYLGGQVQSFTEAPEALALRLHLESPPIFAGLDLEYRLQSTWEDASLLSPLGDSLRIQATASQITGGFGAGVFFGKQLHTFPWATLGMTGGGRVNYFTTAIEGIAYTVGNSGDTAQITVSGLNFVTEIFGGLQTTFRLGPFSLLLELTAPILRYERFISDSTEILPWWPYPQRVSLQHSRLRFSPPFQEGVTAARLFIRIR